MNKNYYAIQRTLEINITFNIKMCFNRDSFLIFFLTVFIRNMNI